MLVTGEAAGSTYAFTGEGIGKAMETALHAAEAILARGERATRPRRGVRADYAAPGRSRCKPRFDLYEQANRANAHPWLVDLLVWSAQRSPRRAAAHGRRARGDPPADGRDVALRGVPARGVFDRR